MKVDPLFHLLLQQISPSDEIYDEAGRRASRYANRLVNDREFAALDWSLGGSFAKRTAVRSTSDADVLLFLDPTAWRGADRQPYKPTTVLGEVLRRLEVSTTGIRNLGHVRLRKQDHSIRLVYGRKETVDLEIVPAFRSLQQPDIIRIPERATKSWIVTSPARQLEALNELDGRHQFVRRTVRLLKRWKQGHRLDLPSYALEVLALEAARQSGERCESGLFMAVLADICKTRLLAERRYRQIPSDTWVPRSNVLIVDPAIEMNNLIVHLDAAGRDAVILAAGYAARFVDAAEAAERDGRRRDAKTAFRAAFTAAPERRRAPRRRTPLREKPPKSFWDKIWSLFS